MNQEDKEELIEMIEYFFGLPRPIINAYCERDALLQENSFVFMRMRRECPLKVFWLHQG